MDEFLKLILTGERLQRLKRLELLYRISALAQLVLALPLLFTSSPDVPAAVSVTLGILLMVSGGLNTVLSFRLSVQRDVSVNEQSFADSLEVTEEGKARTALAVKYAKLYSRNGRKIFIFLGIIPVIIYLAASILTVLINLKILTYSVAVPVLYVLATISTVIIAFIPAIKDAKNRAELYETASEEITLLKRSAGIAEEKICKQSFNAKNTATRSQELFLCDPADRAELRRIAKITGYVSIAIVIAILAALAIPELLISIGDEKIFLAAYSCLIASSFCIWVAIMIWADVRRRAVYKRNAGKLTESEPDKLRRYLQDEFVKLQRNGNIFFSLFCGIPTLTGFILGLIGAVNDPEASFLQNVAGCTMAFFFVSGIAALVIWTCIYAIYRKKVNPVEMQLDNTRNNLRNNYGKEN